MQAQYENHYLTDMDVANFARQSFGKLAQNFTKEQNDRLIKFLARGMESGDWEDLIDRMLGIGDVVKRHELAVYLRSIPEHWVPFAHPHITLRMQAPVPIRTQCFKHKQGLVESEESRRYIKSRPVLFVPDHFRAAPKGSIKQGSGDMHPLSELWRGKYITHCNAGIELYMAMVEDGVCPEQSRFALPQGVEVHWVWTGSLYAYANYFTQRSNSHSQQESQILANQVDSIISPLYPVSWAALTRGVY
jgi:thymidylate synthase (FAD)